MKSDELIRLKPDVKINPKAYRRDDSIVGISTNVVSRDKPKRKTCSMTGIWSTLTIKWLLCRAQRSTQQKDDSKDFY